MQGFPSQVTQYIAQNWASVVITFLISLFSVYGTKRVIEEYMSSATDERRNQAKSDLLDVLENHVINEKEISSDKMSHLMNAVDRKHSVNLAEKLSKVELLQDIELRIEESSHLDSTQKEEYSKTIDETIEQIQEENESSSYHIPHHYQFQINMVEEIRERLSEGKEEEALEILDMYEERMAEMSEIHLSEPGFNSPREIVVAIIAWILIFVTLYVSALGVSELLNLDLLPASFDPLMWGSILTMFIVLGYYARKSKDIY